MILIASMGPPGGGRQVITPRLVSRFNMINMTFPSDTTIQRIYGTMLLQKLSEFPDEVTLLGKLADVAIHMTLPYASSLAYI